jgi:hypothetical protein
MSKNNLLSQTQKLFCQKHKPLTNKLMHSRFLPHGHSKTHWQETSCQVAVLTMSKNSLNIAKETLQHKHFKAKAICLDKKHYVISKKAPLPKTQAHKLSQKLARNIGTLCQVVCQ